jgi:hypothetical protein
VRLYVLNYVLWCSVHLFLQLFVGGRISYLRYYGVKHPNPHNPFPERLSLTKQITNIK